MKTSETFDKLAKALSAAQAEFKPVGKSGHNKFDRYNYAKLEDYVQAIGEVLAKHEFSIVTSVSGVERIGERKTQKGGTEYVIQVFLAVRLIHSSGQWIECNGYGEGQDRSDKAIYKAITGARKYALASMLGLATSDDPESDERQEPERNPPANRPTPRSNGGGASTPQQVLKHAVVQWTGITDRNEQKDVVYSIMRVLGETVNGDRLTSAQYSKAIRFIDEHRKEKFTEALQGAAA